MIVTTEQLRTHADLVSRSDDPDTATALRWAANEIERLRAELSTERDSQISAVNNMLMVEQENERLRAALKQIADDTIPTGFGNWPTKGSKIARTALKAKDKPMMFPDCMMPDGADPCGGFQELYAEVEQLRAALKEISYWINHKRISAPIYIMEALRKGKP